MSYRTQRIIQLGVLALAFFILAFQPVNDPDFGWHLRAGIYYLDHWSIPAHDIFSWTAPNYPWVNHEYGADVIYALLYQITGNATILLSLLFTGIAAYLFLWLLPRLCIKNPSWEQRFLIGFSALLMAKPYFGVRSQVFDWLGIALIFFIWQIYQHKKNRAILWWFPILFLVWANIHGGFPLGLFVLVILMFFHLLQAIPIKPFLLSRGIFSLVRDQRKALLSFFTILVLSFLATLLTAYHYRLYIDLFHTSQGKQAFQFIAEWSASAIGTLGTIPFFVYLFFIILLLLTEKDQGRLSFQDSIFFLFFLFLALSYIRFIPLFAIVSLPVIYRRFASNQLMPYALCFVVFLGFLVSEVSSFISTPVQPLYHTPFISSPFDLHQKAFYSAIPVDALTWLKTKKLPPRMFNDYGWGGEIIWRIPDQKTFIDGRMPHWNVNDRFILQDYEIITHVRPKWYETIRHYDIQWFFISPQAPLAAVLEQFPDTWEKKYQDDQAVVFFKKGITLRNVPL